MASELEVGQLKIRGWCLETISSIHAPTRCAVLHSQARSPVTELQVRMDCGGCVHKNKKAVHSIHDFARQKLTVVGSADPEMMVKAIKKAGKFATICSRSEPAAEPAASSSDPPAAADAAADHQPPSESPPATPEEPPKDAPEVNPSADAKDEAAEPQGGEEIHLGIVHEMGYEEPLVMHSHSSHRAHPYVSAARDMRYGSGDGSQIATMFSDENPNACTII
ncbi:hypothetical protein OPV22_013793 [Ensete ventricosum]|uniref:HMA domain-containing protein n=1 Tax=Ensete ventricosum TaxID=4639 RepID=A0AAV8RA22_ENSVE|nr:hypothetical protein OPV22_013793 [Ensete ventricosum]